MRDAVDNARVGVIKRDAAVADAAAGTLDLFAPLAFRAWRRRYNRTRRIGALQLETAALVRHVDHSLTRSTLRHNRFLAQIFHAFCGRAVAPIPAPLQRFAHRIAGHRRHGGA